MLTHTPSLDQFHSHSKRGQRNGAFVCVSLLLKFVTFICFRDLSYFHNIVIVVCEITLILTKINRSTTAAKVVHRMLNTVLKYIHNE